MSAPNTAEEILSAMAGVYVRCRSYRDVGTVTNRYFPDSRPERTQHNSFWTLFSRPDRFRFEYRDRFIPEKAECRWVAWAHGDEVRRLTDWGKGKTEIEHPASLRVLLTTLGGVCRRVSWVVPSLLPTGWANGKRWKLAELARLDDDQIAGADCYRVQGRFPTTPGHDEACREAVRETLGEETWDPRTDPTTFWIEKGQLLLRRVVSSGRVMNFRFESTADYQPEIDVPLTDAELAFDVG